jgi:hypothetical protein
MRDPVDEHRTDFTEPRSDWSVAVAIALSIIICLAAFIWIFVQLEPFLSDFVSQAELATPAVETQASPEATEESIPVQ